METKSQNRWKFVAIIALLCLAAIALIWIKSNVWTEAAATIDPTTPMDVPLYAGAQLEWEFELTDQDFLKPIKNLLKDKVIETYLKEMLPRSSDPSSYSYLNQPLQWLAGIFLGGDLLNRFLMNLSQIKLLSYQVEGVTANTVVAFHEKEFGQWRRNFWVKPTESATTPSVFRLYTRGGKNGLQEISAFVVWSNYDGKYTNVIVLKGR